MASQMSDKSKQIVRKLTLWHTVTFRPIFTHDDLEPIMMRAGFVPHPKPEETRDGMVAWQEYGYGAIRELPDHVPPVRLPFPEIDGTHIYTLRYFLEAMAFYLGTESVGNILHIRTMGTPERSMSARATAKHRRSGFVLVPKPSVVSKIKGPTETNGETTETSTHRSRLPDLDGRRMSAGLSAESLNKSIPVETTSEIVKSYRKMKDCGIVDDGIYLYRDGTVDERTRPVFSSSNEDCNYSINCNMYDSRLHMAFKGKYREMALKGKDREENSTPTNLVPLADIFPVH